jgi:hypothetical protein
MNTQAIRYAGRAAIVTGVASIVGFIALMLFFALEASQATLNSNGFYFWGFISDVSAPATMIPLLVVVLALHQVERAHAQILSRIALVLGLTGALGVTLLQVLLIIKVLTFEQEVGPVVLAMGIAGVWLVLASYLGGTEHILPSGLVWLGIAVGAAQASYPVLFQALGGADFYAKMGNDFMLATVSGIIFLLSYLGFPIWMFWFARTWSSKRMKTEAGLVYAG